LEILEKTTRARTTQEKYKIPDERCPNCGKAKKEIEKAPKEGKEMSNDRAR
jgi:hypothetical protein